MYLDSGDSIQVRLVMRPFIEKIASVAKGNPFFIYPSHTTGPKDPLKHSLKIAWMRKMFPKYKKNIIVDNTAKTVINIAEKLYKDGYKNLILVAGSDRVKEFEPYYRDIMMHQTKKVISYSNLIL